jgi:hypothetical protein
MALSLVAYGETVLHVQVSYPTLSKWLWHPSPRPYTESAAPIAALPRLHPNESLFISPSYFIRFLRNTMEVATVCEVSVPLKRLAMKRHERTQVQVRFCG